MSGSACLELSLAAWSGPESPQTRLLQRCIVSLYGDPPMTNNLGRAPTALRDWLTLPFFIPSTSFCSLSSWFTSSCAYHSHHLRSHHLSLPLPFTPDLKLISFTNPFLHIVTVIPSGLTSRILTCTELKGHWLCLFQFLAVFSAFESTLNLSIVYRVPITHYLQTRCTDIIQNAPSYLQFFSQRVINRWNSLSQEDVDAKSVNAFKGRLGRRRRHQNGLL